MIMIIISFFSNYFIHIIKFLIFDFWKFVFACERSFFIFIV